MNDSTGLINHLKVYRSLQIVLLIVPLIVFLIVFFIVFLIVFLIVFSIVFLIVFLIVFSIVLVIGSHPQSSAVIGSHQQSQVVVGRLIRLIGLDIQWRGRHSYMWMGWDGVGMVILGHRQSKSTFGANKVFLNFDFMNELKNSGHLDHPLQCFGQICFNIF